MYIAAHHYEWCACAGQWTGIGWCQMAPGRCCGHSPLVTGRWSVGSSVLINSPLFIFVIGDRNDYKFDVKVECASHSLRTTNCPWLGRGQVMWPITKTWGSNHITERAEPKVDKFCQRVGNINSMQQDDISPTKGRGYGHVTVLKFCR